MRGRYRNSIKVNEPGAQPAVFKVITSYFLFFFFSPSPLLNQLSETGHNRSGPAVVNGGQGQAHTQRKTAFNYWGEDMTGDQSPCPCSVSEVEERWGLWWDFQRPSGSGSFMHLDKKKRSESRNTNTCCLFTYLENILNVIKLDFSGLYCTEGS